jgi:hypothetical protein
MLGAHINLVGHYRFELPAPVAAARRRDVYLPPGDLPPPTAR